LDTTTTEDFNIDVELDSMGRGNPDTDVEVTDSVTKDGDAE
jgi:hypothetical protein